MMIRTDNEFIGVMSIGMTNCFLNSLGGGIWLEVGVGVCSL